MSKHEQDFGIEPINLSTGRTAAAEQLRQLIESKRLAPGQRLPSERELAEMMGVGRTTVREAKSTLEALGLIETRQGSGSYVTANLSSDSLSSIWSTWYASHHVELVHLLQVREALETKAVALVVADTPPELLERLRETLAAMEKATVEGNVKEVARLDAQFHGLFAHASGNRFLVRLLTSLDAVLADDRLAVLSLRERSERSLRDHEAIVTAIEAGNGQAVLEALRNHFKSVLKDVEAVYRTADSNRASPS